MNLRDSEVISGLLRAKGYELIDNPEQADAVIFNTCSVRQHAEDKVWSEIGRIAKAKGQPRRPIKKIIGLVGCMAQNYKQAAFERSPSIDFVVGPADIDKIPEILKKLLKVEPFERKIWETDAETRPEDIYHTGFYEDKNHAFVVISEGCSNFCSYCVVPFARGPLRHRNPKDIIKEIEGAIDKGITSVTLLGQNVNAFDRQGVNFIKLIELVNVVRGLKEFGFITSHPKDAGIELFKAMSSAEKLKKYLHLPAQSGSDRILKLMNRGYARKYYLDLADNYRKIIGNGVLTTDIIVGFPTETEEDFQATRDLIKDVQFNAAYIFKYSVRPNTAAAKMADDIAKEEKERRHKIILDLQREISNAKVKS